MAHISPDQCSPDSTTAAANSPAERAAKLAAERAARRSRLLQSGLPVFYRFEDLVAAGIIQNRTTLLRLIDGENFPPGVMIGRNARAWRVDELEAWLASRPTTRKVLPPNAGNPRVRAKRRAEAQP